MLHDISMCEGNDNTTYKWGENSKDTTTLLMTPPIRLRRFNHKCQLVEKCKLKGNDGDDYIQSYVRWSQPNLVNLACSRSNNKYCLESIKNAETKLDLEQDVEFDNCINEFITTDVTQFPYFYYLQIREPKELQDKLKKKK